MEQQYSSHPSYPHWLQLSPSPGLSPTPFLLPNHITCSFAISKLSSYSHFPESSTGSSQDSPTPRPSQAPLGLARMYRASSTGVGHGLLSDLHAFPKGRTGGREDRWVEVTVSSCRYSFAPGFLVWSAVVARAARWLNQQQTNHPRAECSVMESPWKGSPGKMAAFMSLGWGEE